MPENHTILIAEDSAQDIRVLMRALEFAGVQNPIQIVTDGEAALNYFAGRGIYANRAKFPLPGILLLDILMPKKDGLEVLHYVRTLPEYSKMLVIVLTRLAENHYIDKAYESGAHLFLRKPACMEDIQNLAAFYKEFWTIQKNNELPSGPA